MKYLRLILFVVPLDINCMRIGKMEASKEIKSMKLYDHIDRVRRELQELGYKEEDPLKVEDVCKYDQMHYYGTQAIDEAIKDLGISSAHHILDVGSGLGGPARYLAHKTNCAVTALELQEDLHKEAENLTRRCNLQHKLSHMSGDFLQLDLGADKFDFLVSWLVFLHIVDKKQLFQQCFYSLKPGGKIFIEDFFQQTGVVLTKEDNESYERDLYMKNLPEKDVYVKHLEEAGFIDVEFLDLTSEFLSFVSKRQQEFNEHKERHVRVIGQGAYDGLNYFYTTVKRLFADGLCGGCRVTASKPTS
ncbi:uncharacterized protein [Montipora capricornis]|uniref:uncharacterized protein n=1 Tax=Montipora capricornis TaxID=246305 RepID=UPI0035F1035A